MRNSYYLGGSSQQPLSKEDIDEAFALSGTQTSYQCASCGQPPQVKLVAIDPAMDTEDLRKKGYMCIPCANNLPKGIFRIQHI